MQQLFNYITDPTITDANEQAQNQSVNDTTDEVDERVFERIFIPQTLNEISESTSIRNE